MDRGYWSRRRVVVTGGRGFLGRAVVEKILAAGATDIVIPSRVDYDLRDVAAAERLVDDARPDLLIHLAAHVGGIGTNRARPADLFVDNLRIGTNVVDVACRREVPKTVVVGTICSYPKFTPVPFSEDSLWTGYPEETNAPYGIAKLAQLVQLQANREQYGQHGIYLLPTNLYGPGDKFHPEVSHVIPALIRRCIEAVETGADHIDVWGSGSASREFLYVDDAADGIVAAAASFDGPEPVNLGADHETTIAELVEMIAAAVGFTGEIRWDRSKPDGQPRRRVDASRALALFGWRATTPFDVGLARTIEWYRANRAEADAAPVHRG